MRLKLEKYHGLGNDYLVFDPEHNGMELTPERVKLLCNRNLGVGADGILEGPVFKEGKIHMIIWNSDGSQTENSGNGIRIFAKYLKDALDSISTYDSDKKMAKIDIYDSVSPVIIRTGRKGERENLKIVLPARLRDD